jgi:glycosyltransferase involved in cell wall biosynthesis
MPAAAERASMAGLAIVDPDEIDGAVEQADIVHVHFWNTPELHAWLRAPLPPTRIALTAHVLGYTAPHMLTEEVVERADLVLLTSAQSLERADASLRAKAVVAPSAADFARLGAIEPEPHRGFAIGYIGTVDFAKMHPRFVAMHAALDIADARVIVCGSGGAWPVLQSQITEIGAGERFELRFYVEDIAPVLAGLDVFGYPLCEENYATTELVLQEAMYAAVPIVVLDPGGADYSVRDGETGFVVRCEADYVARITDLARDSEMRRRMGAAAAADARARFGATRLAPLVDAAYDRLVETPKRARAAMPPSVGADALLASLGSAAEPFRTSLEASGERAIRADRTIAEASAAVASADAGGVLHYRRFYPDDPALRYWAGLILMGGGRPALAAGEFAAAARLGFDRERSMLNLGRARAMAEASSAAAQRSGYQ